MPSCNQCGHKHCCHDGRPNLTRLSETNRSGVVIHFDRKTCSCGKWLGDTLAIENTPVAA